MMVFYRDLLDKLIAYIFIIGLCHKCVESYADHHKVLQPYKARIVPDGFVKVGSHSINVYLYEIMSCYANKGYPCRKNPAFIGDHVTCLSKDKVCDGIKQCPFGDDENGRCDNRHEICESNQVRCVDDGRCATTCDGRPECKYAADEKQCDTFPCDEHQVLCSDGKCAGLCDGMKECQSGKDEKDCLPKCGTGETICPESGKCAKFCDGKPECDHGEDEQACLECPEQQDIPCDMVRLSNCFYDGFCRFNTPNQGCEVRRRRRQVGYLLMPCAGDTTLADIIGIPKDIRAIKSEALRQTSLNKLTLERSSCKSKRKLAQCMCVDEDRPRVLGDSFEECVPRMLEALSECDILE